MVNVAAARRRRRRRTKEGKQQVAVTDAPYLRSFFLLFIFSFFFIFHFFCFGLFSIASGTLYLLLFFSLYGLYPVTMTAALSLRSVIDLTKPGPSSIRPGPSASRLFSTAESNLAITRIRLLMELTTNGVSAVCSHTPECWTNWTRGYRVPGTSSLDIFDGIFHFCS